MWPLLVLLLLLAGCTTPSVEICFSQQENCTSSITKNLDSSSVCAFYDVNEPHILHALSNATVVVDQHSKSTFDKIKISGLMHHKLCATNNTIITGSTNPTENGLNNNDNNLIIIHSKKIAHVVHDGVLELPQRVNYHVSDGTIDFYFCNGQCTAIIKEYLKDAKQSIHFMIFTFTDYSLATVLLDKQFHNISVHGVIEKQSASHDIFALLSYQGIDVQFDKNNKLMHHKVFIIDNETVISGSFNPTISANEKNAENIVIIHNASIAQLYLKEFNRLR